MPTLSLTHRQLITADEGSSVLHCALSLTLLHRPLTGSYLQLDQSFNMNLTQQLTFACLFMQRETLYVQTLTHAKPPLRQCRFFPHRHLSCLVCACWVFVLCVCPCLAVVSAGILCLVFKFLFLFWAPTTSGTGWISPAAEQSDSLKFIFATSMDQL